MLRDHTGALIKVFTANIGIGQVTKAEINLGLTPRSEKWLQVSTLRRLLSNVILRSVHLMMKKDIELSMNSDQDYD